MTKHVEIFTDGSCLGNPGPGGYGIVLRYKDVEKTLSKGYTLTTNNRMEMLAAVVALQTLKQPCKVTLTTDSQYVRQGITQWIHNWKKRGWKTADKNPVKNADLWQALDKDPRKILESPSFMLLTTPLRAACHVYQLNNVAVVNTE